VSSEENASKGIGIAGGAVAYSAFLGVAFQSGFWSHFQINFLEFANLQEIAIAAAYPLKFIIASAPGIILAALVTYKICTSEFCSRRHRRVLRSLAIIGIFGALFSLIAIPLFFSHRADRVAVAVGIDLLILTQVVKRWFSCKDVIRLRRSGAYHWAAFSCLVCAPFFSYALGAYDGEGVTQSHAPGEGDRTMCSTPASTAIIRKVVSSSAPKNPGLDYLFYIGKLGEYVFFFDPRFNPQILTTPIKTRTGEILMRKSEKEMAAFDFEDCWFAETREKPL
jgi:hypothetical protein